MYNHVMLSFRIESKKAGFVSITAVQSKMCLNN